MQTEGGAPAGDAGSATGGSGSFLFVMLGMIVIFYFLLIRPQMRDQKRRKEMIAAIKKHDRVVTNGGIHGVVASVSDNEVVLKVDESNNVRIKFSRSSIGTILEPTPADQS